MMMMMMMMMMMTMMMMMMMMTMTTVILGISITKMTRKGYDQNSPSVYISIHPSINYKYINMTRIRVCGNIHYSCIPSSTHPSIHP